ncbi:hypothetical protein HZS_2589 [Henneguya salminicola]|nr:hypothetical protein HZS_2589 [Henneguya salminicola]
MHAKKLTMSQEMEIKSWIDENCTISLKTISYNLGVRICKSTAANILTGFSYALKQIPLVPKRRNTSETIDCLSFNVSFRCYMTLSLLGTSANLSVPAIRSRNISICCAIILSEIILNEPRLSEYSSASYSCFFTKTY